MFSLLNRRGTSKLSKRRRVDRRKCIFESLEMRSLLSANGLPEIMASPLAQAMAQRYRPHIRRPRSARHTVSAT